MNGRYKSWSSPKKRLEELLCDSLQGKITYFLTFYHKVHNAYGRASIRFNGKEMICFSWVSMYHQERDISDAHKIDPCSTYREIVMGLKEQWDACCTYHNVNFVDAVQEFLHLSIKDAHYSDNYIIKVLAILDRRTGKRTLDRIFASGEYLNYPDWVQLFYQLRLAAERIATGS